MIGTDVSKAISLLQAGEVVAIPTETVYGLAANALNADAVAKIYEAKERPSFNPLILHTHSWQAAKAYIQKYSHLHEKLAKAFWPGPLSMLFKKSEVVPDITTAGLPNVVIRVPKHPLTLALLQKLDFPLAAPSANLSNTVSPTTAKNVSESLGSRIPYILDGGPTDVGLESTILHCTESKIEVLREGGISREELFTVTGIKPTDRVDKKVQAPGQLKRHYATQKPLYLVDNLRAFLAENTFKRMAVLTYTKTKLPKDAIVFPLSENYNLSEIANRLFKTMYLADQTEVDCIVIERCKDEGIGRAINDRLTRASS
jgi:L-threonylcarbamoyladenylate synthase